MTCSRCGATVATNASACPVCGAPVDQGYPAPPGGSYPPPAAGPTSDARNWALGAHLSAFLGAWVALAFAGPLVVWLIKRAEDPFIDHHAREALNFNLSVLLYGAALMIIAVPLGILTLGLGLIPLIVIGGVLAVAWLVLTIIAAVAASNGELYRYPLTIRFVR